MNAELIKSGNGFDSVRSTDQISNKEYLTQLADKNRRADFAEKKESYKAQIARTGKIIEAMKGAEEELQVPGACKIGTVILPVPPDQITITEQNVNMPINTVRTAGTPKIKTGQQNNRIELTIFFPSLQDINGKVEKDYDNSFRKLLAEFLRSPFLPIENQHIRSLLIPDVTWSKPKKLEESPGRYRSPSYEREVDKNQGAGYFKKTDENFQKVVMDTYAGVIDYFDADIKEKQKEITEKEEELKIKKANLDVFAADPEKFKEYNTEIQKLENDIKLLKKAKSKKEKERTNISKAGVAADMIDEYKELGIYEDVQLACALQSIVVSTVPGFPESLQCNLVLDVFNYSPYSSGFEFCVSNEDALKQIEYYSQITNLQYPETANDMQYASNQNINRTKNISNCKPFENYVKPLLTGLPVIDDDVDIKMNYVPSLSKQNENTTIKSGFNFLAPDNWLRQVGTNDFKRFKCRYDITEFGDEERESLQNDILKLNADIQFKIVELVNSLEWPGTTTKVTNVIVRAWTEFWRTIGLFYYGSGSTYYGWGVKKFAEAYKGEKTISIPIDIPGTDLKKDHGPYTLLEFVNEFEKIPSGKKIMVLMDKQIARQKKLKYGFTNRYKFEFTEDEDTIIAGMSASLETRMAEIPVLNYTMPTKQYMGRGDWVVQVNLQTCNETLMRVLKSLSKKACVSRSLRERIGISKLIARTNSLEVPPDLNYNGLFKVLGITRVLFKDFVCETIKGKPGWWNLTLRLVQSDIDMTEYERLVPSNFFDDNLIEDVKKKLITEYRLPEDNEKDSYIYGRAMQNMRAMILRLFFFVGYGSEIDVPYGHMTMDWATEQINNYDLNFSDAFELKKYFPLYEKVVSALILGGDVRLPFNYEKGFFRGEFLKRYKGGLKIIEIFDAIKYLFLYNNWKKERKERFALKLKFYTGLPLAIGGMVFGAGVGSIVPGWGTFIGGLAGAGIGFAAGTVWSPTIGVPKGHDPEKYAVGIINLLLRQQAIKCILYAKDELIAKFGFKKEQFIPKLPLYMKGNYGNYQDLELPEHKSGFLSTPADFFYIREEFQNDTSYQILRDTIKTKIALLHKRDELLQFAPGLSMLEKHNDKLSKSLLCGDWRKKWGKGGKSRKEVMDKIVEINKDYDENEMKKYVNFLNSSDDEVKGRYGECNTSQYLLKNVASINYCLKIGAYYKLIQEFEGEITTDLGTDEGAESLDSKKRQIDRMIDEISTINQLDNSFLQSWNVLSEFGVTEEEDLLNKCISYTNGFRAKDKTLHMSRAYPTVKLYFIEEDNKEWGMIDDYYTYNAIESIEVISNKNTPGDVATISVSNITGNLSDKNSNQGENIRKEQTLQEQTVLRFLLREGTTIMIKAGYDNNPMNLDTLFIGKVVSVQQGDRVSIVAQSFGAELHEKCFDGGNYHVGFCSAGQTHGDVVIYAMKSITGLSHMGSPNMLARFGLEIEPTSYYTSPKDRFFDLFRSKINPIVDIYYKFGTYDPRLENIYLPFTDHIFGGWLTFLFGWTSKDIGNRYKDNTFDWRISNQSLWEILNEITLYHEDYIAAVLPYNSNVPGLTRQTIYLGPRNGYYKYTDAYDTREKMEKIVKKGKDRAELLKRLTDFFKEPSSKYSEKNREGFRPSSSVISVVKAGIKSFITRGVADVVSSIVRTQTYDEIFKLLDKYIEKNPEHSLSIVMKANDRKKVMEFITDIQEYVFKSDVAGDLFTKKFSVDKIKIRQDKNVGYTKSEILKFKFQLDAIENKNLIRQTKEDKTSKATGIALSIKNPDDLKDSEGNIERGYMPIRNYYYVDSLRHIVDNSIRASSEEISNHVKIRYPEEPKDNPNTGAWRTHEFFADDNIKTSNLKSYISYQNNIDPSSFGVFEWFNDFIRNVQTVWGGRIPTVYRIGYNVLANMMRPMYRGSLTLLGMPQLKVWDIIFIRDLYNGMYGPIEIEQVVQRIDQKGFLTTITPNAIVYPQDPVIKYEIAAMNGFGVPFFGSAMGLGKGIMKAAVGAMGLGTAAAGTGIAVTGVVGTGVAAEVVSGGLAASGALAAGVGPTAAGVAVTATSGVYSAIAASGAYTTAMTALPWVTGISAAVVIPAFLLGNSIMSWTIGKFLGRDCIDVIGLTYKGQPYVAGLEGMYKDSFKVHIMDKIYSIFDFVDTISAATGDENDKADHTF